MKDIKVENLVIFSTLNQITNYLVINNLKPQKVFNITYTEEEFKKLKYGIDVEQWDQNLRNVLKDKKCGNVLDSMEIIDIELGEGQAIKIEEFREKLQTEIIDKLSSDAPIYWHITGGQRIYALAIQELIQDRPQDIIFYLEGNSETMIALGEKSDEFESVFKYSSDDLDFETVFKLMGYDTRALKSTRTLKKQGKIYKDINYREMQFYKLLYKNIIVKENQKELTISDGLSKGYKQDLYKGSFKDLLVKSNSSTEVGDVAARKAFVKELFQEFRKDVQLGDYCIEDSEEFQKGFPAGYIFEKLVGYKIFDVIKDDTNVLGMEMSLKVYSSVEGDEQITDELDIVLLTNTGRIINFECKSGYMSGDNAKSHNFTTYKLSGIFGAPIFMTPLFSFDNKADDKFKTLYSAYKAAYKAKIKTICLDDIEEGIKKLL